MKAKRLTYGRCCLAKLFLLKLRIDSAFNWATTVMQNRSPHRDGSRTSTRDTRYPSKPISEEEQSHSFRRGTETMDLRYSRATESDFRPFLRDLSGMKSGGR